MTSNSLTDESYWNGVWSFNADHATSAAPAIERGATTEWRVEAFKRILRPGKRFIEIGAAGSAWPAFVAAGMGAEAWGIDFSANGLELTARAAGPNQDRIRLVEGDVFDKEKLPYGAFDVVYSGGFVEHFPEPHALMERLAELLAPGGVVVTAVPNLCGVNGDLQRIVDRETFDKHVVISPERLDAAHATAGLMPVEPARFIGVVDLTAVNFSNLAARMPPLVFKTLSYLLAKVRLAGEWYGSATRSSGGRLWAPMVGGVYRKR
jgi:SAM-dependent methyltransferase